MQFTFILVEPKLPENVGAAARAMKTMGFGDMRLVNPCDHLGERARWMAHGSNDILEKATVFESFAQATADLDFIVGATARRRGIRQDYFTGDELLHLLRSKGKTVRRVGVAFGREDRGLLNEEIAMCDALASAPMSASYPSLNLAQAVMVFAYILSPFVLKVNRGKARRPHGNEFRALKNRVRALFTRIDLHRTPNIVNRLLERMAALTEEDVHLLHSVCARLEEKLTVNERSSGRKGQEDHARDARP